MYDIKKALYSAYQNNLFKFGIHHISKEKLEEMNL